ncbi:uncharacterized protein IUM83_15550 [Phytophthora cinnamomi]|uniref:uncharacterized protein n=1 Tax=Phytophthora cinnamomi TaxID=4785 RepID=UPI00355A9A04|nr:hypothetical protein IUM83_15550 [Phytophthora cinnamomi]
MKARSNTKQMTRKRARLWEHRRLQYTQWLCHEQRDGEDEQWRVRMQHQDRVSSCSDRRNDRSNVGRDSHEVSTDGGGSPRNQVQQTEALVDCETLEMVTGGDVRQASKLDDDRLTMGGTGAVQEVVTVTENGPCVAHATESGTVSCTDELQAAAHVESTLQNGAGVLRQRAKAVQNRI